MNKDKEKKKLQHLVETIVSEEFVKLSLKEDSFFTRDPLYMTFVQPFTDIIDTAKAEATKISGVTQENIKKLVKQTAYLVIPWIATSAISAAQKEAEKAIQAKIKAVNDEYKPVYQRTWDALRNRDVLGLTFLLGPAIPLGRNFALAFKLVKDSPTAILQMLEMLSGGHPSITSLRHRYENAVRAVIPGGGGGGSSGGGGGYASDVAWGDFGIGYGDIGESRFKVSEQAASTQVPAQPQQQNQQDKVLKQLTKELQAAINSPNVQAAMAKSPIVKDFQSAALEAITGTLKPVLAARDFNSLKRAIGPNFDKMEAEIQKSVPGFNEMTPELRKQFEQEFVVNFKEIYKTMIANQIGQMATPGTEKLVAGLVQQIKNA